MTANCVSWKKTWIWNHQGVENFRHQRRKGNHNKLILWWEPFGAIATFHVVSRCGDHFFLEPYFQASQCFERNWKTWVTWHFPGIKLSLNGLMARFLFTMKIHDDLGSVKWKSLDLRAINFTNMGNFKAFPSWVETKVSLQQANWPKKSPWIFSWRPL